MQKKSISKVFFSTTFLDFCAVSGCFEVITVQLIGGCGLDCVMVIDGRVLTFGEGLMLVMYRYILLEMRHIKHHT